MHLPSEVEAIVVIPALRAMLARELLDSRGMSQAEVGALLGITQSAVSNYVTGIRGRRVANLDEPYIRDRISDIALSAVSAHDRVEVARGLAELTQYIRKNRLMCGMHRIIDPGIDVDACHICES